MNLVIKINQNENTNIANLIKDMTGLECRLKLELQKGFIIIEEIEKNDIENVMDCINENFTITGVNISKDGYISLESLYRLFGVEDLEIENQLTRLMQIISGVMKNNNDVSQDICYFLKTVGIEISMKYNPYELINFEIGNVVDVNYGNHLDGEISGGHVHAIVCDIDEEGLVYAVPITKRIYKQSKKYLPLQAKKDVNYFDVKYKGGTALLGKGSYIRPERIDGVVGQILPNFFKKLLECLPKGIQFSYDNYDKKLKEKLGDVQNDDAMLSPVPEIVEKSKVKTKNETNQETKLNAEEYLTLILADALNSLDREKPIENQIDEFLDAIQLPKQEKILKQAFLIANEVDKIRMEEIINYLQIKFPKLKSAIIKNILRKEFKEWIEKYPEVKERYPKMSIMTLLKVFAKQFS